MRVSVSYPPLRGTLFAPVYHLSTVEVAGWLCRNNYGAFDLAHMLASGIETTRCNASGIGSRIRTYSFVHSGLQISENLERLALGWQLLLKQLKSVRVFTECQFMGMLPTEPENKVSNLFE
jgi:hypothetical protein